MVFEKRLLKHTGTINLKTRDFWQIKLIVPK